MKRLVLILLTLLLLVPAAAASARSTEVGISDDRALLPGGDRAARAVAEWRKLGVDNVRIFAQWRQIAPRKRPAGFNGANPASAGYQWTYLDGAVARVRAAGMTVTLTITGPGPAWTSSKPKRGGAYRPRTSTYRSFATAVARRYGAQVNRYILWNEPNISGWLAPQATCSHGRCKTVAPHLYRSLVRAAYPAVKAADPGAQVLIGALSPRGQRLRNGKMAMRPLLFLRRLGCRNDRFVRIRSGACRHFKRVTGDGFAIHPYSGRLAPSRAHPNHDDVALASIWRLTRTLDRLQGVAALDPTTRRFGIYVDEYGYQTNPPDRIAGVSPSTQDRWLQEAAYVGWRNSRIKLLTQYLWRDEPRGRGKTYAGWQSGLRYASGRAKRSLSHFDTPFVLDARRNRLWGQVRPGGAATVTVQQHRKGGSWRTLAVVQTDARGYWTITRRLKRGTTYRYKVGGATSASRRR